MATTYNATIWNRDTYYPHHADEETAAQPVTCTAAPGCLSPESGLLATPHPAHHPTQDISHQATVQPKTERLLQIPWDKVIVQKILSNEVKSGLHWAIKKNNNKN